MATRPSLLLIQPRLSSLTPLLNRQLMATRPSLLLTQPRLSSLTPLLNRQLMASLLLIQPRLSSLTPLLNRQLMATRPSLPKKSWLPQVCVTCESMIHFIKLILHFIGILKCRSRCASQRCPCKKSNSSCGEFCHPGRKCINILQKDTSASCSYIELSDDHAPSNDHWVSIEDIKLTHQDKETLNYQEWLNDSVQRNVFSRSSIQI